MQAFDAERITVVQMLRDQNISEANLPYRDNLMNRELFERRTTDWLLFLEENHRLAHQGKAKPFDPNKYFDPTEFP